MHRWCRNLLVALALVPLGCAGSSDSSRSPQAFNWQQFKGTTIQVRLRNTPWAQATVKYIADFEELTGIKVDARVFNQGELWTLLDADLGAPGRVDVYSSVPALDGRRYLVGGSVLPINDYLRDHKLTLADYQWEDFFPKFRAGVEIDGAILGPPIMAENLALIYRKDVFQQYKVSVPRTLEDLEAAARLLNRKPFGPQGTPGFALVGRGKGPGVTGLYASLLQTLGGTWLDANGEATINGPQSLAALDWMRRLLGSYAPPDVASYDYPEAIKLFSEGRAAMYIDGSSIYPLLDQTALAPQVGYASFPAGPKESGTVATLALTINKRSFNPGAAWLFVQWATSREMVHKALMHGVLVARESAWQDKMAREEVPADLAQTYQLAGKAGFPVWAPPIIEVTEAREALGKLITTTLQGGNIRAAADETQLRFQQLIAHGRAQTRTGTP
ncbi:MAG TPA: sugar ABC transporter substrate-binding protein [Candidatus Baltobacteraceae bacterium]|nr:sugar ABC transporter substrate-binding protein [Candidatus Baltobacteraceae bacterium]